jgi:hypothetical protein
MVELVVGFLLYGAGFLNGWAVFDKKVVNTYVDCPAVKKPDPIKGIVIQDCIEGCPKEYEVKMTKYTRGDIDRMLKDCRSFEKTTFELVDNYNKTVAEQKRLIEKDNYEE